ncbi:hypothetical protein L7F22_029190 [Adiantum nelumboides]|nr:hypothetical protein [Adiantum nelumboides]
MLFGIYFDQNMYATHVYAHGAYFMNEYGSFNVKSTQGMENLHYHAKGVYFKNTQYRAGKVPSNYLVRIFDWFLWTIFGRVGVKEHAQNSVLGKEVQRQAHVVRFKHWCSLQASQGHQAWQALRLHQWQVWVLHEASPNNLIIFYYFNHIAREVALISKMLIKIHSNLCEFGL